MPALLSQNYATMFNAPPHILEMLEQAWTLSFSNNAKAKDFYRDIQPELDQLVVDHPNQKEAVKLIKIVLLAGIRFHSEQYEESLELLLENIGKLKAAESIPLWLGRAYGLMGVTYRQFSDQSLAIEYLLKRLQVGLEIGDQALQKSSYNTLGNVYADAQDHEKAAEYFKLCVPFARQAGDVFLLTFCFANLAESLIQLAEYDEAREFIDEAIETCQAEQYGFPRCIPIHVNGVLETALGNFERSLSYFEEAQKLNDAFGNDYTKIRILEGKAKLHLAWGKPAVAIEALEAALDVCQQLGNQALAIPILEEMAGAFYDLGEHQKAADCFARLYKENSEISRQQTESRIQNMQYKFETEAAQKEAELLQEQNRVLENRVAERTKVLEDQRDQLEYLNSQKNAFLTVLTHDMRAPLTNISLHADLLLRRPELVVRKPHYLEGILESQKMLSQLVENILDLEKLEVGQPFEIKRKPFNLVEIAELMVDRHLNSAQRKEIALKFSAERAMIILNGDQFQIQRVLSNLITNAIKYTPAGGDVTVIIGGTETHAKIVVRDSGLGIDEGVIDKIFVRYYRVDSHKSRAEGAGLGLSIVKAIVDAHEGEVTVRSRPEKGSCFKVFLPLR